MNTSETADNKGQTTSKHVEDLPTAVPAGDDAIVHDPLAGERIYALDPEVLRQQHGLGQETKLKLSPDGQAVLIPQPSADPRDTLNWPAWKKDLTLAIISAAAATADFGSAMGSVTLLPQAQQWHLSPNTINHATAGNVFMLGAGGLFVVWFSAYFGRLPVLFFFQCMSLATAAWCAAATGFNSFMAARILNGFFSIVASAGGLMFIKDMFFFHEYPRKINIWATAQILAPFLGPLFSALIIQGASWRWAFWMLTIIDAVMVVLTVAFLDETFWPRDGVHPVQKSRYLRLVGIEQRRTKLIPNSFFQAGNRLLISLIKLPVLIGTVYHFFTFAWVIGNNITISVFIVAEYEFSYNQLAAIFVAPVIGGISGQVAGHWVHDMIAAMYIKRHNGIIIPEARLILIYLVTPLYIIGMNLIGWTLQHHWHYMWLAFGWFLHNFSAVGITTALFVYLLDAYPEASGEVAAWLNVGRTSGGFVVGYVQIIWAGPNAQGIGKEFAIQSGIVAASFFMMVFLHFWGPRLRKMQGPMKFRTQ